MCTRLCEFHSMTVNVNNIQAISYQHLLVAVSIWTTKVMAGAALLDQGKAPPLREQNLSNSTAAQGPAVSPEEGN